MKALLKDVSFALRLLIKSPVFTLITILVLALGIGANTALFSVVNSILNRPSPYENPERIVMVWEKRVQQNRMQNEVSPADFLDWRKQSTSFEHLSAFAAQGMNLMAKGETERITGARVSDSFFSVYGTSPAQGRTFSPEDDTPGGSRVVVLSHALWQQRFGSDPSLLGKTLQLDGQFYTVVGVMPPKFGEPVALWVPIAFDAKEASSRNTHYLYVLGRLAQGVSKEQAQTEMDAIAKRIEADNPAVNAGHGVNLIGLGEWFVGPLKTALLIVFGVVSFVLLIACTNVANLLLARAAARRKEFAIRAALGAGKVRLVRQLLTESVLLSLLGGAAGIVLAYWLSRLLVVGLSLGNTLRVEEINLDLRVVGYTLLLSLLTGVLFGLAPALHGAKHDLSNTLKEGSKNTAGGVGQHRFRNVLVISEIALALTLLIGAGLLLRSFMSLQKVDPGFDAREVVTAGILLPQNQYGERPQQAAFFQQLLESVKTLPGVQSAGVVNNLPLSGNDASRNFSLEGQEARGSAEQTSAGVNGISSDYFAAMGIPLKSGRAFSTQDDEKAPGAVIINETMARRYWPGGDPLGKRLRFGSDGPWFTVVGVVGDVKHRSLTAEPRPELYVSFLQEPARAMTLVVRTSTDPTRQTAALRNATKQLDKNVTLTSVRSMASLIENSVVGTRMYTQLLGGFALLALALAVIGLYGVISFSVSQRAHELGIRMALGARPRDILGLVMRQGMGLVGVGILIGLAASFALTRVMSSLLYGVSTTDPVTFVSISLVLAGAAALACYLPARKATRVDPMVTLRYE